MKVFPFLFFTLLSFRLLAQLEFEEERLNQQLKNAINDFRKSNDLSSFQSIEVLDAVAFDQAEYLIGKKRISHTQDNKKKAEVSDRLMYYGALYAEAGENAAMVGVGSKENVYPSGQRIDINTEEQAIAAALYAWMDGADSELNLRDPYFVHFGSAVIKEGEQLILVVVMAGLPYQLPGESNEKVDSRNLKPFKEEVCNSFLEEHATLPQLFSDAFKVEGDQVFFEFHSLPIVEQILSSGGDGISVEVVCDDQFACGESNRLYPVKTHNGFLLPISKKGKLSTLNEWKEKGAVRLNLGKLPDFYREESCELNGLIIKDGHMCEHIPYNQLEVQNLRQLDIPFILAGDSMPEEHQWEDTLHRTFRIHENFRSRSIIDTLNNYLSDLNYDLKRIDLKIWVSPLEHESFLADELKLLSEQIHSRWGEDALIHEQKKVDRESFKNFKKNTIYALETEGMDKEQLQSYLKETLLTDTTLAAFFKSVNRLEFTLTGRAKVKRESDFETKASGVRQLIEAGKVEQALLVQRNLIEQHLSADIEAFDFNPAQIRENLQLISNQIVAWARKGKSIYKGNPLHLAFLEIYLINPSDEVVSFNKHLAQLRYWAKDPKEMKPDQWEKNFSRLKKSNHVQPAVYAKTMANFWMLAADHYFEKKDFAARKKAFDNLMKWEKSAELSEKEKLAVVQYFCYQDQFNRAIELLLPIVNAENVNPDLLFYFLQIAIYDEELVSKKQYFDFLKKALDLYPNRFCQLFSKEKRGIQALEDYQIKELYCDQCQ